MNTPYVKHFDKNGVLLNPITAANPFTNHSMSVRGKSETHKRTNNRKNGSKRGVISRLLYKQLVLIGIGRGRTIVHRNNRDLK